MTAEVFNEDYFMRGEKSGVSNFTDYRWQPDATISMVTHLKRYLALRDGESLLDVGCARGFYVKALRMIGVDAYGYDVSQWAIEHCDPEVKPYVSNYLNGSVYDVVFCKDVAEHIEQSKLETLMERLLSATRRELFFIVPLAVKKGGRYVHEKEEKDATHVNRWTLHDWIRFFEGCSNSFIVSGSYRYPGLKPGAYEVTCGYGFLKLERI